MSQPDTIKTRRMVLGLATMSSFLTPFVGSSINIALPSIGQEFQASAVLLSWVASAYLLTTAVCLLPLGRLADSVGRQRVFRIGIWIYTASSVLAALTPGMAVLIMARVLHGVGSAMIFSTGMAMVTAVYPPGERGRAIGIAIAAVYIGLSLGPTVGGALIHFWGWRSIFILNVLLGLVPGIISVFRLPEGGAKPQGEIFDWLGSLVYGVMLVAGMLGLGRMPSRAGCLWLAAGLALLLLFFRVEKRAPHPVLHLPLFRTNVMFAFSNLAALINYCATFAVGFLLSLYLQYIQGLSPHIAGLILVVQPVIMAVVAPYAGTLSDRIESRIVATIGMALNALGIALLAFLGMHSSLGRIMPMLVLLGLGFAFFATPNTNAVMSAVDKTQLGVASATLGTMRLVGQMFSMGVTMLVFALLIGPVPITAENGPDFLCAMRVCFACFSVLCGLGIPASLARGKRAA